MAASIPIITTTASNSMRVKPPSSVLRSSSIRHKNQENTFLPFLLHVSFRRRASARSSYLFGDTHRTFSEWESEPRPWRIEPRSTCRTWRWSPDATEGAPLDVRVSPSYAVGYNAPQDGKNYVEAGNGGAGARGRFRVAWHLRADNLSEQAGRGASRPVRLRQLRLSRIGAGRARQRPQRPQQPGFRWKRNSL